MNGKTFAIGVGIVAGSVILTGCAPAADEFVMPDGLGEPDMPADAEKVTAVSVAENMRFQPVCPVAEGCHFELQKEKSSVMVEIPTDVTEHEKAALESLFWENNGFEKLQNMVEASAGFQGRYVRFVYCLDEKEFSSTIDESTGEKVIRVGITSPWLQAYSSSKIDGFTTFNDFFNSILIDYTAKALAEGDADLYDRIYRMFGKNTLVAVKSGNIQGLYISLSEVAFKYKIIGEISQP